MILYHIDEKWFYVVLTQSQDNVVTYIGLEREDHFVQHQNHTGKEMYIVTTGYEVRDNDITNGGRDFPVAVIRVSKMVKADRSVIVS